jgi:hydantoinase/carbamoylase family amidase
LEQVMQDAGARPRALVEGRGELSRPAAFVELHIEQGRQLELAGIPLAVVDGVVGIRRWRVIVSGQAGHAGTTPMPARNDALTGAAELVLAVEAEARIRARSEPFVATVGKLEVRPGGTNVIPGEVIAWVEARALSSASLDQFEAFVLGRPLGAHRECGLTCVRELSSEPVEFDTGFRRRLEAASAVYGVSTLTLPSGAGHDAARMAAVCPSAMLFVPCRNGVSHDPAESASATDIALGAAVMAEAVRTFADVLVEGAAI